MKLKYISGLPAILIMIIIFLFSSKPADNSNENSLAIADNILTVVERIVHIQYKEPERTVILEKINHIVRKGAHFSEYALLSFAFAFYLFINDKRKWKILIPVPVCLSAIYAMTDEFHQTFIIGRSGRITDVLIDTSGATAGAICFFILFVIYNSKKAITLKKGNYSKKGQLN